MNIEIENAMDANVILTVVLQSDGTTIVTTHKHRSRDLETKAIQSRFDAILYIKGRLDDAGLPKDRHS